MNLFKGRDVGEDCAENFHLGTFGPEPLKIRPGNSLRANSGKCLKGARTTLPELSFHRFRHSRKQSTRQSPLKSRMEIRTAESKVHVIELGAAGLGERFHQPSVRLL